MDRITEIYNLSPAIFLFMLSGLSMFCGLMAIMIIKDKWITRIDIKNMLNDLAGKGGDDE